MDHHQLPNSPPTTHLITKSQPILNSKTPSAKAQAPPTDHHHLSHQPLTRGQSQLTAIEPPFLAQKRFEILRLPTFLLVQRPFPISAFSLVINQVVLRFQVTSKNPMN